MMAGRFGLGKDMNALASLKTGNAEETRAVDALLGSTQVPPIYFRKSIFNTLLLTGALMYVSKSLYD